MQLVQGLAFISLVPLLFVRNTIRHIGFIFSDFLRRLTQSTSA